MDREAVIAGLRTWLLNNGKDADVSVRSVLATLDMLEEWYE